MLTSGQLARAFGDKYPVYDSLGNNCHLILVWACMVRAVAARFAIVYACYSVYVYIYIYIKYMYICIGCIRLGLNPSFISHRAAFCRVGESLIRGPRGYLPCRLCGGWMKGTDNVQQRAMHQLAA